MQIRRGFWYRTIQLCSNGLFKTVPEGDLSGLTDAGGDTLAEHLVAAALERETDDNVTAVTVEVLEEV